MALRNSTEEIVKKSAICSLASEAATLIMPFLLRSVRYIEASSLLRVLICGLAVVVLVQIAFDTLSLLPSVTVRTWGNAGRIFGIAVVLTLGAGVQSLSKPAFVLPMTIFYLGFRHQFNAIPGVEISETDALSIMDIGVFAAVSALSIAAVIRGALREV